MNIIGPGVRTARLLCVGCRQGFCLRVHNTPPIPSMTRASIVPGLYSAPTDFRVAEVMAIL